MADREAWYGDAAEVPLTDLLSDAYNAGRRALIGAKASYDLRPGSPGGRLPRLPALAHARVPAGTRPGFDPMGAGEPTVAPLPGAPTLAEATGEAEVTGRADAAGEAEVAADGSTRGDTCHLDVVDRWGNMIAATPSGAGSSPTPWSPNSASRSAPGCR